MNTSTLGRDPLLLPIRDVGRHLGGIGKTTVYKLIGDGELTKVNIGSRGFVTTESVAAYIDRLKAAAKFMTATDTRVQRHTCPACRCDIAAVGLAHPVFRPHTDGVGRRCPMTGEPVPEADGS